MKKSRKLLFLLVAISTLMICFVFSASAAKTSGDYTYITLDHAPSGIKHVSILNVNPDISGDIVIPDEIDGYPVTSINTEAFKDCTKITSVKVPYLDSDYFWLWEGVFSIADGAFKGCTALKSVELSVSVGRLGANVFEGCTALENFKHSGHFAIKEYAFKDCTSLKKIYLPRLLDDIAPTAFYGCSDITFEFGTKFIDSGIEINKDLFEGVKRYSLILDVPIAERAFINCKELISLTFKDVSVENPVTIGTRAFMNCVNLKSVVFCDNILYIDNSAFDNCTALESLNFDDADALTEINSCAFSGCRSLTIVELPENLERLQYLAFLGCDISELTLPVSCTKVSSDSFIDVKKIHYEGSEEQWLALFEGKDDPREDGIIVCIYNGPRENHKHDFTYDYKEIKGPNFCIDGWEKRYYCVCGDFEKEFVESEGHTFTTYIRQNLATCYSDDYEIARCDYCVMEDYRTIPNSKVSHKNDNHDSSCDYCRKNVNEYCTHKCHKGGFFYKISLFFWKIFKMNKECACGMYHY